METDYTYYLVYRSNNKGDFWTHLTVGMELGRDEAFELVDRERKKFPNAWFRVLKVQVTTDWESLGDSQEKEGNKKKEPLIHGYTVPEYIQLIEKAHEASKNSKLVFK